MGTLAAALMKTFGAEIHGLNASDISAFSNCTIGQLELELE